MNVETNNINISLSDRWSQLKRDGKEIYFRGYFYYKGKLFTEKEIEEMLSFSYSSDWIKEVSGEFAFIFRDGQKVAAAVDRKRSIPLFYYKRDSAFILTDELSSKHIQAGLNDLSKYEFILTGYVASDRTLFQDVWQIEAGQMIICEEDNVKKENYFHYYHSPVEIDVNEAAEELEKRFKQTFEQMYKRVKDKGIIIPLSGGYDSRIIALLLKEMGAEKITTFTYGHPESKEALRSKEIATRLGLEWTIFPYNKSSWYKWYHSAEWQEYEQFGTNESSMAHIQDFPAVRQLLQEKQAADHEYVFIPGHSGDFIAGSHIPYELTVDRKYSLDDVANEVMKRHHRLWTTNDSTVNGHVHSAIKEQLQGFSYENREEASALFEYWDWKERQCKFIINSLRVYEFYNQDWEIPLWDDSLVSFFLNVPVEYRFKKYLYDFTLHKMYPDYFDKPVNSAGNASSFSKKYGVLYPLLKSMYNKKELYSRYHKDPMEWYGITGNYMNYLNSISFKNNGSKYVNPYNINSILVKNYMNNLKG